MTSLSRVRQIERVIAEWLEKDGYFISNGMAFWEESKPVDIQSIAEQIDLELNRIIRETTEEKRTAVAAGLAALRKSASQ